MTDLTAGIDVGGTFTDVAVIDEAGRAHLAKAATTPRAPAGGVLAALGNAAVVLGTDLAGMLARTRRITHGSTIATNAILTRSGPTVGLITTRGFEDTPFVMRAVGRVDGLSEEEVRHVAWLQKPVPLVERRRVLGVAERIDVRGEVVVPLRAADAERAIAKLVEEERVGGLAVCLLNSWRNPAHEELIARIVESRYAGDAPYCSYSSRLSRIAGEYARTNTVLVDAFVGPALQRYLRDLEAALRRRGFTGDFLVMQGNGGSASVAECPPVATLQSGPAGGMLASAHLAALLGHSRVLTADMGGTSFDVGVSVDGEWRYAEEPVFGRFRIMQPIIEIESIGAGGGTLARFEADTRRIVVGPQSAGADPGPACYATGGTEPTVTDANVVLGVIDPAYFFGGNRLLEARAAREAVATVARPLGVDAVEAAAGIQRIIEAKMADLIRRAVIRSGHLPEDFVLYAYGGASGMHAVGFARELGIKQIYVFPTSPVFSAFGIALADVRHTRLVTCQYVLPVDPALLEAPLADLERDLAGVMAREGFGGERLAMRRYASLRYLRQTHTVELELPARVDVDALIRRFHERYEALYGVGAGAADASVEVSGLRVDAIGRTAKPSLRAAAETVTSEPAPKSSRSVYLDGRSITARIYEWGDLRNGQRVAGPAIVESPFTTVLVPVDAVARVDAYENVVLELR